MTLPSSASQFVGRYQGAGAWLDVTGESKQYRIAQTIEAEARRLLVAYVHDFHQEGSQIAANLVFEFTTDTIFSVSMRGSMVGYGYVFGDYLHFNLQIGEMFVEASYQLHGDALHVRGSSNKNAQGRFIAWHEQLGRHEG